MPSVRPLTLLLLITTAAVIQADPVPFDSGRWVLPDAQFPNDVAFDDQGRAYVSDTRGNCIHRLVDQTFTRWFVGDEIGQPNGLLMDGDHLLYGNQADGCLYHVAAGARVDLLLDTTASGAYCADFEYVPSLQLLVMPGLYDNRLTAYRWDGSGD